MTPGRVVIFLLLTAALSGCRAAGGGTPTDVSVVPTTQGAPRQPAAQRQVRVWVRDQASAGVAESLVGRKCRVQLRRDALGMAAPAGAPLQGRWASQSSIDGTVVELTDQWLVIEGSQQRYYVPLGSILVVELQQ